MIDRLLTEQRWMLPWILAIAAADTAGLAAFVLGWATGTPWATFVGLGLVWVGALTVLGMCWAGKRRGWR